MKKFLTICAAAFIALAATVSISSFTGCKSTELPSTDTVMTYGRGVGFVTAIVVKLAKVDTNVVDGICQVLDEVNDCIPTKDQTFAELWPEKIAVAVKYLIAKGKIDPKYEDAINKAGGYVCKALDALKAKYPVWFEYEALAKAAIDGFIDGFHTVSKYRGVTQAQADAAELSVNEADVKELCITCGVQYKTLTARRR